MWKNVLSAFVSVVLLTTFVFVVWVVATHDYRWEAIAPYRNNLLSGWLVTLLISVASLVLSVLVGALFTAGQLSGHRFPAFLCRVYVEVIRGTPLLTQILIGYYLIANAIDWHSSLGVGIVVLSCFSGAYLSEIFRGGIESIPKSQWLSARAIGFTGGATRPSGFGGTVRESREGFLAPLRHQRARVHDAGARGEREQLRDLRGLSAAYPRLFPPHLPDLPPQPPSRAALSL